MWRVTTVLRHLGRNPTGDENHACQALFGIKKSILGWAETVIRRNYLNKKPIKNALSHRQSIVVGYRHCVNQGRCTSSETKFPNRRK
jgi:hypothetical protein